MLVRVLLAIDAASLGTRIEELLRLPDVILTRVVKPERVWSRLGQEAPDLIVATHTSLPDSLIDTMTAIRRLPDPPEMIVLVEQEDAAQRAALLAAGALAVVYEGLPDEALGDALRTLVRRRREAMVIRLRGEQAEQISRLSDFASSSSAMQNVLSIARRVAGSDSSLLLLGETGTGKEWMARAIHSESRRGAAPFIPVSCAAVPESLLESELFGHEKGAFTGAVRARRGYFELAHRGTLFLDEIGEMPLHLQSKLLRALQDREIQRLGSESPIKVDVRIMAATNADLSHSIAAHTLRRDLYYRLAVVTLTLPPLRERREDIPALLQSYLHQFRQQLGRSQLQGIASEAVEALLTYEWPGNVRELINVLEHTVLLCQGEEITLQDLPPSMIGAARPSSPVVEGPDVTGVTLFDRWFDRPLEEGRKQLLEAFEREYLTRLLRSCEGRVGETAQRAGIDPRTLFNKMKLYGLRKNEFRKKRA